MFLNVFFEDYKQKIECDHCGRASDKKLIFNFNLDKNADFRAQIKMANYNGVLEFNPICIRCECVMDKLFKVEITHKEITGIFLKARAI